MRFQIKRPAVAVDTKHCFADFLRAVQRRDGKYLEAEYASVWQDDEPRIKTALSGASGTLGGWLVPEEFAALLLGAAKNPIVYPRALVLPMSSDRLSVPTLDLKTAPSSGDTAYFGGLVARWIETGAAPVESEPRFGTTNLVANTLAGYSVASMSFVLDAAALEMFLLYTFGTALHSIMDQGFLVGNGVGKPLGILRSGAAYAVARGVASDFSTADAGNLLASLIEAPHPYTTCWITHPLVYKRILLDNPASFYMVPGPDGYPQLYFMHLPFYASEWLPTLGTAGDVILADLSYYLVGMRSLTVSFSDQARFSTNEGVWRFVARVAGQPWLTSQITLSDAATVASPFVYLS